MRPFILTLLVVGLLTCICLDRYLTWNSLDEIKDAHEANLREMVRIATTALSQKGAVDALAVTRIVSEQLDLSQKVNLRLGQMLGEAYKELESLKQSNRDLLEMFNKPDRET